MRSLVTVVGTFLALAVLLALPGCNRRPDIDAEAMKRLRSDVETLQAMVQLHEALEGSFPTFSGTADEQWAWLTEGAEPGTGLPDNPLSPTMVGSSVIVIDEPGTTGMDVDPRKAGWVWNAADKTLYACGVESGE